MVTQKQAEEAIVASYSETDGTVNEQQERDGDSGLGIKSFLRHGGSVYDAWFSCASNQVAQVLLTLPYSFSQLGMLSGILFQIFYGIMGSWGPPTSSVSSTWSIEPAKKKKTLASRITLYREIMHAMWKPQKFKYIYLMPTLYVFTLTLPSASAVYWAFGDQLLTHSNAFSVLPKSRWRDFAVILMLIHQFITFGFACTPLYFVWEKVIGMHDTKSICLRAIARLPVVIPKHLVLGHYFPLLWAHQLCRRCTAGQL